MRIYLSGNRSIWNVSELARVRGIMEGFGLTITTCGCMVSPNSLQDLSECDAVAMLDGWETCKACKLEAAYADYIEIQCSGWRDYVEVVA